MGLPTFLILLILVLWDVSNLKRFDYFAFKHVFQKLNRSILYLSILTACVFFFLESTEEEGIVCLIGLILSIYLLGREQLISLHLPKKNYENITFFLTCDFLRVVIVWLFASLIFSVILFNLGLLWPSYITEFDEILYTTIFSTALVIYLINEATTRLDEKGFWFHVGLDGKKRSNLRTIIFPALIGLVFAISSVALVMIRPEQPDTPLSGILEEVNSPFALLLFLFLATVIAPFVEEIIFRGYFYNMICRIKGERIALYVISLSFGVMHMGQYWGDWAAIGIVTVLGFVLTMVRVVTQTTLSSIVLHYTYNGSVAIITTMLIARDNPELIETFMIMNGLFAF